ncbi:uncharacterized protein LOC111704521 isoform X2 [Eurytemora carolleeae]|uniref:uncharacterized protein LOC111704521 isoform X1 n=1 Tax=Eurytemora carolleeae TaxID=1294199 RepID=UPI000C76E67E|nr:uncharacterized protein LOC111704521 isoform X1 [Eurytemora carolleeae]XP_023332544.1 uncharacterized protein LOC111704521 isoform X2 [Eurytemora carolleeae]|eukprot:XP_023332543.1 uncharacterized protein LOC111704521 isoform X1 [Eurytemora affinis]
MCLSSAKKMATLQFKGKSPYEGVLSRKHDASDFKYERYTNFFTKDIGSSSPVCLALFGLGRAGSIHLSNIIASPRLNLRYIVEANKDLWEPAKARWNLKDTMFIHPDQVDTVYQDKALQACLIATPTFTHEGYILGSLGAGLAVFSEKPIAEDPRSTVRCYQKADQVGKPLFCAFNRRFDPAFASIRSKVRSGKVGHVQMIKTTSRDSPLPSLDYLKISGGIYHDCAVHDIDMITWVLGEYPTQVFSVATAEIPEIDGINDFDNVAITMKFPSGSIGMIDLCRFANYGYDQRLEVFGHEGMLHAQNDTPNKAEYCTADGSSQAPMYYSFPSRHADGYIRELEHFLDVVQNNEEMSVTDRMTAAVSKIADACEESARSGKPVQLNWTVQEIPKGYVQV